MARADGSLVPAILPGGYVDPAGYGYVPGAPGLAGILQAVVDAPVAGASPAYPYGKLVELEPGAYSHDRPVFLDRNGVCVRGLVGGRYCTSITSNAAGPVFVLGIQRYPGGRGLTAANFVPIPGVPPLGSMLPAGAPAGSYGLAFQGSTALYCPGSALALGPVKGGWPGVDEITWDLIFDFGPVRGCSSQLFSVSRQADILLQLRRQGGPGIPEGFRLTVTTADGVVRQALGKSPVVGIMRFTCRVNAWKGEVTMWADDRQIPVDLSAVGTDWALGGHSFKANEYYPACIGSEGLSLASASDFAGGETDPSGAQVGAGFLTGTLYAFAVSTGQLFADRGVGTALSRVDGNALDDYGRYYEAPAYDPAGPNKLWSLYPVVDPAAMPVCPVVPTHSAQSMAVGYSGWAYFLPVQSADAQVGAVGPLGLSDLTLTSMVGLDSTVLIGHALHTTLERLDVDGGAYGVGSTTWGAHFPLTLRDCRLGGYDAALFDFGGVIRVENCAVLRSGRCSVRLAGCKADVSLSLVAGNGAPDWIVVIHGDGIDLGGVYDVAFLEDFEALTFPKLGVILCEVHRKGVGGLTALRAANLVGVAPIGGVGVRLVMPAGTPLHCRGEFAFSGLALDNSVSLVPLIQADVGWTCFGPMVLSHR